MSNKFTPWSQSQAEKQAAAEYPELMNRVREDLNEGAREGFLRGVAWAAEMIEASPTVYGQIGVPRELWDSFQGTTDTHQAKRVGARPIEE